MTGSERKTVIRKMLFSHNDVSTVALVVAIATIFFFLSNDISIVSVQPRGFRAEHLMGV